MMWTMDMSDGNTREAPGYDDCSLQAGARTMPEPASIGQELALRLLTVDEALALEKRGMPLRGARGA